jgi:DNA-binding transcriptional LysR family regulator
MELYQLRSFAAVAATGHLTRAAEKLHVSQPALSAQIKALEDELGVLLFERGPTGMTLTAAGKRLLPEAESVVNAAQSLRSQARALQGETAGHLTVGTVSDPEFLRLPMVLSRALEKYPLLEIELHHEISGVAFEKVRDGALDAAFYFGDREDPKVSSITLRDIAYRIVAPGAWRERIANASWEEIAAEPWLIAPSISTHYALASELFRARGSAPERRVEVDNEGVISALVTNGLGVSLMREDLAQSLEASGELCVWSDVRLPTSLRFIFNHSRRRDPALRSLVAIVRDTWQEEEAGGRIGKRTSIRRRDPVSV